MSELERNVKASAVMEFVDMIRGAYEANFIDNHPTVYDIYRTAQMHVKDRYGVDTKDWDDELAEESRKNSFESAIQNISSKYGDNWYDGFMIARTMSGHTDLLEISETEILQLSEMAEEQYLEKKGVEKDVKKNEQ